MNLKILCAWLAWTDIMTPLRYIFSWTSFRTLVVFHWSHSVAFLLHTLQTPRGTTYPCSWQCTCRSREEGVCRMPRASSCAKGESHQPWSWNGCVWRGSVVQEMAVRLLGEKCHQNPWMNPSLCIKEEEKLLLFRALQHGEEGVQPTTVYPWAPFLHFQVGYHPVIHPGLRASHGLCVVLTSLAE